MPIKILILKDNLFKEINQDVFTETNEWDLLEFDTVEELPLNYSKEIYSAVLFLCPKVNNEVIDYIKKLRLFNNAQLFFVLGTINKEEIYKKNQDVYNLYIFEKSAFIKDQIYFLLKQLKAISENSLLRNQINENTRAFIANTPENILLVDSKGDILSANREFINHFNYRENEILKVNINKFIPNYSHDDLMALIKEENLSDDIATTFVDNQNRILPVNLKIIPSPYHNEQYYIFLKDKTEVLNYKNLFEQQRRFFTNLRLVFDQVFKLPLEGEKNLNSENLSELFNCDYILHCYFSRDTSANKYTIHYNSLNEQETEISNCLEGIIFTLLKKQEISILQFSEQNNAHKEILNYAKTAVFIPAQDQEAGELIILLYANYFEPDQFINESLQIFKTIYEHSRYFLNIINQKSELNRSFKEIVENAVDGLYRSTLDGKIIYANPAFLKMLGYNSFKDISQLKIAADLYEKNEDRENFVKSIKKNKGIRNYITNLKKRDGTVLTVIEHAHLVKESGGAEYIEGVLRDISENKHLEENLKKSRLFSNRLIENASVIITVKNEDNIYLVWNKKAEQVSGYSKEEIIGNESTLELLYPEKKYRNYVKNQFDEHFYQNTSSPVEVKLTAANGEKKIISWTAIKLKTDDGIIVIVNFGIDLTNMRKLEKRFNENRQMAMFNSLTDKIAQEYKELLTTAINSFNRITASSSEKFVDLFKQTDQHLREVHQFSDLILSLSSKERRNVTARTDADEVIENSIYVLNNTLSSGIKIDAELNSVGWISLDEAQLNQIILNLALNAVDAIGDDGKIVIKTCVVETIKNSFLKLNNAVSNKYLNVTFSDTGKGMNDETKRRMFEPFFTTSKDRNRKGLGSTLIFNIIKAVQGFITVDSEIGKGSSISFYLPLIESEKEKDIVKTTNNSKILVVDDQEVIRELLNDLASTEGYKTILAKDGLEGLQLFEKNQSEIGLAILDIIMPNLYGSELYYKLKEINPDLRVIITYGHHDPKIKQQLTRDGVDGFLPKPFDIQTARNQIRTLLRE